MLLDFQHLLTQFWAMTSEAMTPTSQIRAQTSHAGSMAPTTLQESQALPQQTEPTSVLA